MIRLCKQELRLNQDEYCFVLMVDDTPVACRLTIHAPGSGTEAKRLRERSREFIQKKLAETNGAG
jgi:hypothetical protein